MIGKPLIWGEAKQDIVHLLEEEYPDFTFRYLRAESHGSDLFSDWTKFIIEAKHLRIELELIIEVLAPHRDDLGPARIFAEK